MDKDNEIFQNFLIEMGERLQDLEDGLDELEQAYHPDIINKLFRAVHTIKGGGGFFGLTQIAALTHEFEDLLMKVREGELTFNKNMLPVFFSACDSLRDMHETDDQGASLDINELCSTLKVLQGGGELSKFPTQTPRNASQPPPVKAEMSQELTTETQPIKEVAPKPISDTTKKDTKPTKAPKETLTGKKETKDSTQSKNETIRVKVDLLNKLMELTGEIVLGRNQLLRQFSRMGNKSTLHEMAHMISDLQQLVLQTRMQPIGSTFTKFNRIVRDLSKQLDKPIRLNIKGEDTELDRSIIESLSDPLTHLIRNCADHGLEPPDERLANGKAREGSIWLEAKHEGGQVAISVRDNGRGIDAEKVKAKSLANQVITQAEADSMGEKEAAKLIFHPGLSTADSVTSLSGRGVGMDVVKSTLEKLGGAIDLETKLNEGTHIIIHLPTTLTIMSSLIIRIEGDRFAVPHSELKEVILVRPEDELQIEQIRGQEVYRLRGNLIPILTLAEISGVDKPENTEDTSTANTENEECLFLVLHSGTNQFGLRIDSIDHTEEIVVKPLAQILSKFSYYAGSSILGDSDVAMVLSANGICQSHKLHNHDLEAQKESQQSLAESQLIDIQEKQDLLVFKYASDEQMAIPLSLVFKVEQIDINIIQSIADNKFINLEGKNTLLLFLDAHLELKPLPENLKTYYIIVPKIKDFNVGIVASTIEESVHTRLNLDSPPISQQAILGITTIREQITYVIDLFTLAEQVSPERFKTSREVCNPSKDRLLVVEDTPFFRDLEKTYFESVGFRVTLANNGQEAIKILKEKPNYFNIVVSDIVMPVMDGYELVKLIKSDDQLSHIPVVALTSFSEEEHREKALAAGFDDYAIKTNKETILHSVHAFLDED